MRSHVSVLAKLLSVSAITCAMMMSVITHAAENAAAPAVNAALDEISKETMAVLDRHQAAMASNDVDIIASDYSDDVVLLLSFVPQPLIGKAAQKQFLAQLLHGAEGGKSNRERIFEKILEGIVDETEAKQAVEPKMLRREAVGEYAYLIADLGPATLTETYVIRNGKIVFESVTVMPKIAPAK